MTENDWGVIINYMSNMGITLDKLPKEFGSLDETTLKELLTQSLETGQKTWVLQSFLLKHVADNAGPKLRTKAIKQLASDVGMSRTNAFDLIKINKEILSKDFTVSQLEGIGIGHFQKIIRSLDEIKKQNLDPIQLLKDASDNKLTIVQLEDIIKNRTPIETEEVWYEVKKIPEPLVDSNTAKKLQTHVEEYTNKQSNTIYLKIRQYK